MTADRNLHGNIKIAGENNRISDNVIINLDREKETQLIKLKKIIARQNAIIRKLLLIINDSIRNEKSP